MTTLAARRPAPARHGAGDSRPSLGQLFRDQLAYSVTALWRSRIALIFTFVFPLTFLAVIGALVGNGTITADSPVPVMQFVTPSAAVLGALFGAYPPVAYSLADDRERSLLRRVRGAPLPGWVYLAGRIGAAALFAVGSLVLMLVVGVIAYDVRIQWHTMAATAVSVLASVMCFAAAGVAVAALARSAAVAQAVTTSTAVMVAMLSGLMGVGDMPAWADRIAQVFPVKAFNDAVQQQFDPLATGNGWDVGALAVIAAWTAAATVVAVRAFRWDPVPARARRADAATGGTASQSAAAETATRQTAAVAAVEATTAGRPGRFAMVGDQGRWATRAALRDAAWVVFAIAFPVTQYLFSAAVMGKNGIVTTPPFGLQIATGMVTWGAALTALVFVPDAIARAREQGVLKRLRGTPLQIGTYFAGRFLSAALLVLVTAVLIVVTGALWFGLEVGWRGVAPAVGLLLLGTASLAACGLLLVAVLPSSKAVVAVGLGVAMPLAFFSDVFAINALPHWMSTVGSFFPLKPLANSMSFALDPTGPTVSWSGIAVMALWLVAAALIARWRFRWSVRT